MPHALQDKHLLSTVICPKHFAHAKFESFNRSVNGWGFKRLLNPGPDCKSYYHECFFRGRPELTKLMQRLVNPGKRLPDKAGEPDFYEISRKYPLPPLGSGSGGATQDQDAAPVASSPHHGQRPGQQQGGRFTFPPTQAGGYPYGYYPPQAGAYPQMPSPASGGYPAQPGYPPQPPQGAYWPQMPPMYAPMPGYYPYPQMMAPQGYDPQQAAAYGQHPMYGQPYPPGTPTGYPGPGSPERAKEAAAPGQPYPQPGPQGPYYPSPGARAAQPAGGEDEAIDDRKPAAQAGVKRPLEEDPHAGPGAPPQPEGSEGAPAAAAAAPAASAPEEGDQVKDAEGEPKAAAAGAAKREGGDGINEQQLLQDFFQNY